MTCRVANTRTRTRTRRVVPRAWQHTNAYKSPLLLETLLPKWTHITYIPSNSTRLQRFLMQRMRGVNVTRLPRHWDRTRLKAVATPVEPAYVE
jgi:hypothetical protein